MMQQPRIRMWLASPVVLAILVLVGGLLLYGMQFTTAEMNGDAAVYASQVARADLTELTLHSGFLALGIVFDKLLPGPTTLALNALSTIFGALGAGLTAWLTWRLTGSRVAEIVAGLGLLLAGNYWTHAMYAEVYVVQTCLLVLTWTLWLKGRGLQAGLVFLAAMLVSPLSALALPLLLMIGKEGDQPRDPASGRFLGLPRQLWRQGFTFGLAWVPIYSLFVWLNHQEYFHRHSYVTGTWRYDLPYSLGFLAFSFLFLWPLILLGTLTLLRKSSHPRRPLFWAMALTLAAHVLVVGRLSDHGAFFLPVYPLAAVLAGIGGQGLWSWQVIPPRERRRWLMATAGLGLLAVAGALLALTFPQFGQHARRYLSEFNTPLAWLYPITAAVALAGWSVARRLGKDRQATTSALIALLLAWQAITSQALMVSPQLQQARQIQGISTELEALRSTNSFIIASWSQGALYEYYTSGQVARQGWWEITQEVTEGKLRQAIREYEQVWLIHPYGPDLLRESGIDPANYRLEAVPLAHGVVWQIKGE